ncbi:hypothetical protein C5B89_17975 [Haloferax sp. Atlit-47N]|uniref:hypothetical protein n=1 Tax=Haloferax sp. Atlit-47N TaxID=2077199 RepID=UPI000E276B31|nr:hypothetical protein [Haloferax sp. Atlit-47N]RDZ35624.1 hypothetical protein C5B89_17975 [Haloferax sp. Atlit-47N]
MPSIVDDLMFNEPSGKPFGVIQLCGALIFSGFYLYAMVVENSTMGSWLLFMAAGSALSGIAESLPKSRRRTAGILRLTGIFVLMCLLGAIFFAPELMIK